MKTTLVPKIQDFLNQVEKFKIYLSSIEFKPNQTNARESLANTTRAHMTDHDISILAIDDTIMNGNYPVPIRIYNPNPSVALPVAIFIHGGGHMCGSIPVYDGIVRKMTKYTNHIIVAIDYRLAPEFPYPTGIDDSKAVITNIFEVFHQRKILHIGENITLIGDSGGAAICTSIVMDKSFVEKYKIEKQVLIYPSTDYTLTSPTIEEFASGYLLEKSKIAWYFDNYFQNNENRRDKSPLYGEFYEDMPSTLIIVASHDPLRHDGEAYYQKLLDSRNHTEITTINGVIHAYLMLENLCKEECEATYERIAKFL